MKEKKIIRYLMVMAGIVQSVACTTVKEYQKNRINDSEMSLVTRKVEKTETSVELYKEGSSGANGGRAGGGCGCN